MKLASYQNYMKSDPRIGRRVELPVWSDQWMQGARFGEVRHVIVDGQDKDGWHGNNDILCVKCDNPRIKRQFRHFSKSFNFV